MSQCPIVIAQSGRTKSTIGELKASLFVPMSSQFALLKTLDHLEHEAILTTLCILDRDDLIITTNKKSLIEEIVSILKPFEEKCQVRSMFLHQK